MPVRKVTSPSGTAVAQPPASTGSKTPADKEAQPPAAAGSTRKKTPADKEAANKKKADVAARKAEAARKKAEKEEAKRKKQEEAARKKAEKEEAKKKKQEEAARKKAEREEAKRKKQEEAARKKAEKEEARKKKAEEDAKRKEEREKRKNQPKAWQYSKARKLLELDIKDETISLAAYDAKNNPQGTKAEDAYNMRPDFQQYPFEKFVEYLETMRQSTVDSIDRANRDAEAVAQFRRLHPKPKKNHRGEPRWEGSVAEARLKQDMDEGKHLRMLPSEMRKDTPEYQDYNPKTFSSHIDQETRARKFEAYLRDKNEKKLEKLGK